MSAPVLRGKKRDKREVRVMLQTLNPILAVVVVLLLAQLLVVKEQLAVGRIPA